MSYVNTVTPQTPVFLLLCLGNLIDLLRGVGKSKFDSILEKEKSENLFLKKKKKTEGGILTITLKITQKNWR